MSATFTIKINAIRTGTIGNLSDVVKRVDFTVTGEESGQTFELPKSLEIGDPDPQSFIPLQQLQETNVIQWLEDNYEFQLNDTRNHIQMVLTDMVAKAGYTETPMPAAPAEETETPNV